MSYFNWKEEYSVGVAIIDVQHKKLIELINLLHESMKQGKAEKIMNVIIRQLIDYTGYHFREEERLMAQINYYDTQKHMKEHIDFVIKVKEQNEKLFSGPTLLSLDLSRFLKKWLMEHILSTDKKLGAELKNKGIL